MKPFGICLWFDTEAEEAAKFYTSIFKNGRIGAIARFGKEGFEYHGKPEGSVMTVEFEVNGQKFVAVNGGPQFKFNESFSLMVSCESQKEIDEYWEKLLAGGGQPSQCGWLKDRFGFSWQVVPAALDEMMASKDPEKKKRVTAEMFKMVKFDIAALQRAFDGK
ncbi:MAG: VOC family protein [Bdellovibrionaceae bacterium]|nr:VOC family protein [Pseudobdellovibrionaceae bacterium]